MWGNHYRWPRRIAAIVRITPTLAASRSSEVVAASSALAASSAAVASNSDWVGGGFATCTAAWAAAPSAGLVLLGSATGTGSSGVLSFTSITGSYRELYLRIYGRSDTASTNVTVQMTLNSDTTAGHYVTEGLYATTTTPGAFEQMGSVGYITAATLPAASSSANVYGSAQVWIPEYAATSGYKPLTCFDSGVRTLSSGNAAPTFAGGIFTSTAAITRVDLTLSAGNWTTASRASLYGITTS